MRKGKIRSKLTLSRILHLSITVSPNNLRFRDLNPITSNCFDLPVGNVVSCWWGITEMKLIGRTVEEHTGPTPTWEFLIFLCRLIHRLVEKEEGTIYLTYLFFFFLTYLKNWLKQFRSELRLKSPKILFCNWSVRLWGMIGVQISFYPLGLGRLNYMAAWLNHQQ